MDVVPQAARSYIAMDVSAVHLKIPDGERGELSGDGQSLSRVYSQLDPHDAAQPERLQPEVLLGLDVESPRRYWRLFIGFMLVLVQTPEHQREL